MTFREEFYLSDIYISLYLMLKMCNVPFVLVVKKILSKYS